mmetsp:Transcript_20645/g.34431  ORF Transcript_20645/g.34431 Transcript_20645/m.34431 type:complete len:348 (+) Transcript_20645:427-1470(+)
MMEQKQGNLAEAKRLLTKAIEYDTVGTSWNALAAMEVSFGNYDKARQLFLDGITKSDLEQCALLYRGWALMERKITGIEEARRIFQLGQERCADAVGPLCLAWALTERRLHQYERARELFEQATLHCGKDPAIWCAWASMEETLPPSTIQTPSGEEQHIVGGIEFARQLYRRGTEACGGNPHTILPRKRPTPHAATAQATLLSQWARLEARQEDVDESRLLFKRALSIDPRFGPGWAAFALLEYRCQNYAVARNLFSKATWHSSGDGQVFLWWAAMEEKCQQFEEARELYRRGTEADGNLSELWEAWAQFEVRRGNMEGARQVYQAQELTKQGRTRSNNRPPALAVE